MAAAERLSNWNTQHLFSNIRHFSKNIKTVLFFSFLYVFIFIAYVKKSHGLLSQSKPDIILDCFRWCIIIISPGPPEMLTWSMSLGSVPELFLVGSPKAFVLKAPLAVFSCRGCSAQIFISSPITGPMCAQAHTNTLFAESVVYVSAFLLNTLLFAICVWLKSASKTHVVRKQPLGDWAAAPC